MATATTEAIASATDVLRLQGQVIHRILRMNTEGLAQEDSLIQPQPAGNCLNWNVGHLVWSNEQILSVLQQAPVLGEEALERYARGSKPLCDPAEAFPLDQLLSAWDASWARIDRALAHLAPERLAEPAPFSPRKNPDETVGSLLSIVFFHQASHTGQTALLRTMAGKPGAIR
ncbi:MAG TPA: DinB family protein [Acidobacteriaceae bacterium]|jgi:uncharacterized damage-inducible protein DinB|nr:DinB family protein [Acidobacteriaceae bacterium]